MGVMNHEAVIKNIMPVILAGVLGIYGLIISAILVQTISGAQATGYSGYSGYAHLASGLCCGLSSLAAGLAIGIVGDAGVRANGQQPKLFVPMVNIVLLVMPVFCTCLATLKTNVMISSNPLAVFEWD
jgi:V-type H+-transporting ATPase proteolipid subunit